MTKKFTIQEVEKFSGIKAATLRIWEKRFDFCKPERINGFRMYSLKELELLVHLSLLKDNGLSISQLSRLNSETILKKSSELSHDDDKYRYSINRLIITMFSIDDYAFENYLNRFFNLYGVNNVFEKIIIPFLEKITIKYESKKYNEVLIALSTIRGKIIYFIESLDFNRSSNKSAVLFLPKNEHFDLILLYACYVLKSQGYKTIYLGTNIPEENIIIILEQNKPDHLYTYVTSGNNLKMPTLLQYIQQMHPDKKLNVISNSKTDLVFNENTTVINFINHQQFSQQLQTA